jgi:hypothetical protein
LEGSRKEAKLQRQRNLEAIEKKRALEEKKAAKK